MRNPLCNQSAADAAQETPNPRISPPWLSPPNVDKAEDSLQAACKSSFASMTWNSWAINEQPPSIHLSRARVGAIVHKACPFVPTECGQASEQSSDKLKIVFEGKDLRSLVKE